jgi:hypothetical protein
MKSFVIFIEVAVGAGLGLIWHLQLCGNQVQVLSCTNSQFLDQAISICQNSAYVGFNGDGVTCGTMR